MGGRGATDPGFVRSWRGTANAQESGAALVSDTLLCLDEIGVAEARDAAAAVYQLVISDDATQVGALVSEMVVGFQASQLQPDADGQVRRAAARLALVGVAGELAREWGIVPWAEGEAMEAATRSLSDWIATRGGTEPAEVREAILQVRRFFEAHGEARFEPVEADGEVRPVLNRVGWRRRPRLD